MDDPLKRKRRLNTPLLTVQHDMFELGKLRIQLANDDWYCRIQTTNDADQIVEAVNVALRRMFAEYIPLHIIAGNLKRR